MLLVTHQFLFDRPLVLMLKMQFVQNAYEQVGVKWKDPSKKPSLCMINRIDYDELADVLSDAQMAFARGELPTPEQLEDLCKRPIVVRDLKARIDKIRIKECDLALRAMPFFGPKMK